MDIFIKHGDEKFKFNLYEEIKIDESKISEDLTDQPTSYSFLTMLHKNLIKTFSDKELSEKRAWAKAYIHWKEQKNPETQRNYSDDLAKAKAELDAEYIKAQRETIEAKFDMSRIDACVRSYEQRKDILQTLSANSRREIK